MPVYSVGGKEFLTLKEAEDYKNLLVERLNFTYHTITYAPDLTEGRGYYKKVIVGVEKGYNKNTLIHFLTSTLGKPIVKVMGVSPTDSWLIKEEQDFNTIEDLENFLNREVQVGVGDYRKKVVLNAVYIDDAGEVIDNRTN